MRTAVLEHTDGHGVHHDWLIEDPTLDDPTAAEARLWTARVAPPPRVWPTIRRFELAVIAPHRRHYLTYQGKVLGGRGHVRRVAEGVALPRLWADDRIELDLQMGPGVTGRVTLGHVGGGHWVGTWA